MVFYVEAGLCLASTYLGYRAVTPPNAKPKEVIASKQDIGNTFLYKLLLFWQVAPTVSGLAQTYYLLKNPNLNLPWRREFNIGMGLIMSSGLLRLWTYRVLDKFFTFELSVTDDQKVIDKGPYSVVRHPSYTGLFPFFLGNFFTLTGPFNALCTLLPTRSVDLGAIGKLHTSLSNPSIQTLVRAGLGVLATLTTLAYSKAFITRIPEEEEMLAGKLGQEYKDYQKRVPYRLVPYIW